MRRLILFSAAATAALLAAPAARAAQMDESQVKLLALILTIGGAVLVAFILISFSQRSGREQFQEGTSGPLPPAAAQDPKLLLPAILDQLGQLTGTPQQRQQVARTVNDIVSKTLNGQVDAARQELEQRYGAVIEEQRRTKAVLERKYQDTLAEKKQTSAVLESIAEGLVVINNRGEVVMMNPAAEKLLAVKQEQRVGKPLMEHLKEGELISLVRGKRGEDQEIVLNAKDDSTKRILRSSNAVITDENGATVGMVAVLSDVTKQRELDQLKTEFLSKVSHELRTPIVAMQHAIAILADQVAGPMSEDQHKFLSITQRNLGRLNLLINDLLDLSKLEAHKMELNRRPTSIRDIVDAVLESVSAWAETKALTMHARVDAQLPEVSCDAARITQVLTNLVGNSIKFTPKQGRITLEAKLTPAREEVEISVADSGVGIAPEDLPKLFSKFQQVGERIGSDLSGTGLGLAIAKEIIDLHQGRIWAESDRQGARFAFTLPLAAPSAS